MPMQVEPHSPVSEPGVRMERRVWISLIVLSAVSALNNVDRGLFALLLPEIQKSIPLGDAMVGLLLGPAFMVVYSAAGLPIAWAADRWNRRNIIALGLAFWSLVTAITGAATRPLHLLFLRGALGLGEASNIAPTMALVADTTHRSIRPFAFAVITVGTPVGTLLFFPLVGQVSAAYSWRTAFMMMGIIGIAVALLVLLLVREPRAGVARAANGDMRQLLVECKRALSDRPFRLLIIGAGFFSFMFGATSAWVPAFLVRTHGLTVGEVGTTLGVFRGATGIIASLAGGALAAWLARRDARWVAWFTAALCGLMVPAELLLLLAPDRAWWETGLALESLFFTAAIPCTFALVVQFADSNARTQWSACYLLLFNIVGQSLGPYVVGMLSQWFTIVGGSQALRYALLVVPFSTLMAGLLFWRLAGFVRMSAGSPQAR
jgi:predicted MFS family arabinose efflux permease